MSKQLGLRVKKKENFSKWYLEVINKAGVMDTRYGVKGFQVYMPLATFVIREIQHVYESELERKNHKPIMFPVVISEDSLTKEGEHIKGFKNNGN